MARRDLVSYQHIIWDWNGTLLDDLELCLGVINGMLRERGLPELDKGRYQEVFDFPVQDYYRRIGFDFSSEPWEAVSTEFITRYEAGRPGCQLMAGARDLIELLQRRGLDQIILSASKQSYLEQALIDYGLEPYFQRVLGLDNHHAAGKAALAQAHFQQYPAEPGSCLLIGDTSHDAQIARELEIDCLLIPNGHHSRSRLAATGGTMISSLLELKDRF